MAIKCPKCHSENPETKQFCADCGTQLPPPQARPPRKIAEVWMEADFLGLLHRWPF